MSLVPLPSGEDVVFDRRIWDKLIELGMNPRYSARSNGRGKRYVHAHSEFPRSHGEPPTHEAARLVICLDALLSEDRALLKVLRGKWRVRFRNGDHFDLRVSNLEAIPTAGKPKRHTEYDLRRRLRWLREGKNPAAEAARFGYGRRRGQGDAR